MSTMKKSDCCGACIEERATELAIGTGRLAWFCSSCKNPCQELIEEPQEKTEFEKDLSDHVDGIIQKWNDKKEPQDLPGTTQNKEIPVEESGERTITKKNAIGNMHFLRMMTSHRNSDWEKAYDELLNYIENSQPTTSSNEWEEGGEYTLYLDLIRTGKIYERKKFKKIVKELEHRVKELEEIHAKENCIHMEENGELLKRIEDLEGELMLEQIARADLLNQLSKKPC